MPEAVSRIDAERLIVPVPDVNIIAVQRVSRGTGKIVVIRRAFVRLRSCEGGLSGRRDFTGHDLRKRRAKRFAAHTAPQDRIGTVSP